MFIAATSHFRRFAGFALLAVLVTLSGGCNEQSTPQSRSTKGAEAPAITTASNARVLKFKVTSMHCQGCADGIKDTLAELPGVIEAEASFADSSATVKPEDPTIASKVIESITAMQFKAELEDQG